VSETIESPDADTEASTDAIDSESSAPRRRRVWPWLLLLIAIGAAAGGIWLSQQRAERADRTQMEWQQVADELRGRQTEVDRSLDALRARQQTTLERLDDVAASQRVVRGELLGISERSSLLEDALTRLAQSRQEGAQAMLLDEAEFLLLTGEERASLFNDPASAIRAFALADSALASLDEPIYATVRPTIAAEIASLRRLPADRRAPLRASLSRVESELRQLPTTGDAGDKGADKSRIAELLGQLVTVRRLDEAGAALTPLARAARMDTIGLQLRLALSAYESGDHPGFVNGINAAVAMAEPLFDDDNQPAQAALSQLRELSAAAAPIEMPALGAALAELRGLRAMRRIGGGSATERLSAAERSAAPATSSAAPAAAQPPKSEPAAAPKPEVEAAPKPADEEEFDVE
jgi:uroporphyrin-3 C-methyltransferase